MRLTAQEQAMLDGVEGPAMQKAMDLLVRYGEALGADRLFDTNDVCATAGATTPFIRDFAAQHPGGMDAVFSEFSLDSAEVVNISIDRNRLGTHLIEVEVEVKDTADQQPPPGFPTPGYVSRRTDSRVRWLGQSLHGARDFRALVDAYPI